MTSATAHPVVLYARVSQARDERSKSVDDQLAELRQWARREGWPVVAEFRDDNASASKYSNGKARPGWAQAMAAVTSGRVRALLVWELSRATRDKAVSVALETACATQGAKIGYGGRLHDPATADGEFSVGLDALLAARESAMTSERVKRAVDARAARGRPHAGVPYGYRRVVDPTTGIVTGRDVHPEHGPIVIEIVRRLLDREPADAIARDLNQRGVLTKTGKQWRGGNLAKLARNPAYAGLRVHGGQVLDGVKATWPVLVSLDDHHRLRALYASPERDKWRAPKHQRHLGTGLYRCGREGCDGRIRAQVERNKPSRYHCQTCYRVSRQQEPVDYLVETTIIKRLAQPDILDLLAGPDSDEQRRAAASQVTRLRAEEVDMRQLVREGRLTPMDQANWRAGWLPRIQAAEAAARPRAVPDAVTRLAGSDAARRWAQASIGTRRAVLDALAIVTILPIGSRGGGPFDPDFVRIEWRQEW